MSVKELENKSRVIISKLKNLDKNITNKRKKQKIRDKLFNDMIQITTRVRENEFNHSNTSPHLEQVFLMVHGVPPTPKTTPVYIINGPIDQKGLVHRKFMSHKTGQFIERMASGMMEEYEEEILKHTEKQPVKNIIESVSQNCNRQKWFGDMAHAHCEKCWDFIMREFIGHFSQVLVRHFTSLIDTMKESFKNEKLDKSCLKHIGKVINQSITLSTKTLQKTKLDKKYSKSEWVKMVETLFMGMINTQNQLIFSFQECARTKHAGLDGPRAHEFFI
jgi:hypothetical protein